MARMCFFIFVLALATSACQMALLQTNTPDESKASPLSTPPPIESGDDDYELSKAGAEELNKLPLPKSKTKIILPSRSEIRSALLKNRLAGDSANGEIGGYKITSYTHTCSLLIENKSFHVVSIKGIIQLASFARASSKVVVFDESMKPIHELNTPPPLFCEGPRLFFEDYKMQAFYGKPETQLNGNVWAFSENGKKIDAKKANLNFYRFKNLPD
jgi:hypothetical protein